MQGGNGKLSIIIVLFLLILVVFRKDQVSVKLYKLHLTKVITVRIDALKHGVNMNNPCHDFLRLIEDS